MGSGVVVAENFNQLRRDISSFLTSLRSTADQPLRGGAASPPGERERYLRTIMLLEEARHRFNSYTRMRREPTVAEWAEMRTDLLDFIKSFMQAGEVDPALCNRQFRVLPALRFNPDRPSAFFDLLARHRGGEISVGDALVAFESYVRGVEYNPLEPNKELLFDDLDRIVPRQQVAPIQFGIIDGRIVINSSSPKSKSEDRKNIKAALDHIMSSGEQLISNLENSNCDKRLLESVKELQNQLGLNDNIVKIGLTNMACGVMGAQFHEELPDAINGMFNAYNASISMYAAQFPEWEQFTRKVLEIDLDDNDIAEVDAAAGEIVAALNADPSLAEPEVPKTIAFIRQFLSLPGKSTKRVAFAMIRTIENLVSSILRYSVSFLSKTADKTVDRASTATAKILTALLGLALVGATGIGPAAVHAGAPWVRQAAEIVQKQIEKGTK